MHTSSYSDVADTYQEKISKKGGLYYYEYDKKEKELGTKDITITYLYNGTYLTKKFTTYFTEHGPIMAKRNNSWISVKSNNRDMKGLVQSWQRTKSRNYEEYKKTMELLANPSNNTVYADDKGNIAYWHGNFMPRRDPAINWSKPVDGTSAATEWKGLHTLEELIQVKNPATGWIQNCNSTPFTVSGSSSPKKSSFPVYMAPMGENFRGVNAARLLGSTSHYTIDKIIATGYDTHLSAFDVLIPALLKAYENNKPVASGHDILNEPIKLLAAWDRNTGESSIATTLAVEWGQKIWPSIMKITVEGNEQDQVIKATRFAATASANELILPMQSVITDLEKKFGKWQMPWGEINRYQRLTGNTTETYDDTKTSIASGFTASTWGCLASFVSRTFPGTNKRYGVSGNSFICAIEFGKKVKAKSLLAGGVNGDPSSRHFTDQAEMYTKGKFKDVLFYKEDVLKHVERNYHPGE
jgi:acyl-homoserine lactone acylase PvdQ